VNILAVDSSTTSGSVAILKDDKLTFMSFLDIRITHSERLLPQIDFGLKQSKLQVSDLDLLVLANGPGSFTGLRIGLATLKGLSMAHKIPILPVNTLFMLAQNVAGTSKAIMPILDAKMNEVYAALYTSELQEIIAPVNAKPEEFLKKIEQPVIAVGNGLERYSDILQKLEVDYQIAPLNQNFHNAVSLLQIAIKQPELPKYDMEKIAVLEPYYLRRSQAEIVKENKIKGKK
jgi:tRNA threonylcarbamoyladenosine biosynthesis protein TsaB